MVAQRQTKPHSKLAAIMFADVEDFARSMEADQVGTLRAVSGHFKHVIYPSVAKHLGRVLKTMGDGYLAEFDSAVSAVLCAIDVQNGVSRRNTHQHGNSKLRFRMGVHVGEILIADNDVFGHEVNLAARLQTAAEPGGICISMDAYKLILGKCPCTFDDLGERWFKSLSAPVHVFAVKADRKKHSFPDFSPSKAFFNSTGVPTIALLPFETLVDDADKRLLEEAIYVDISTELARTHNLILIGDATAQYLAKKTADSPHIANELGVHYLLSGSVVSAASESRLTLRLVDTRSGAIIWAEHFSTRLKDSLSTRVTVIQRLASLIESRILNHRLTANRVMPQPNLRAFDYWLRGQRLADKWEITSDNDALALFIEAVRLDPGFARGHASIAGILNTRNNLLPGSPTRIADQVRAKEHVSHALELDPDDGRNHLDMAWSCMLSREFERADLHFNLAQSLSPYDANVAISSAQGFTYLGDHELGISLARKAAWLNPLHPHYYSEYIATIYFLAGRYEECLATADKIADMFPELPAWQAAAAAQLGLIEEAQRHAMRFRDLLRKCWAGIEVCDDDAMISWLLQIVMLRQKEDEERLRCGLSLAGFQTADRIGVMH